MYFDPMYLLFVIPALIFSLYASFMTKFTFNKYADVFSQIGLTGHEAAAKLLSTSGVSGVKIEETQGFLSDHYDPTSRTLRLSTNVYNSRSLSSIGVACHEAGHAIQHAQQYAWLGLRSSLVPATTIASYMSYGVIMMGFIFQSPKFVLIGALLFSATVLFSIVTLPVEWDASHRAKLLMVQAGVVTNKEAEDAGKVLNAAFMTYVAAVISSLMTLLYYLWRAGVFGRRND